MPVETYLHSTMFLLILIPLLFTLVNRSLFTFHNVSINSQDKCKPVNHLTHLHSTMFLLIRYTHMFHAFLIVNLHSTMFLLIRIRCHARM